MKIRRTARLALLAITALTASTGFAQELEVSSGMPITFDLPGARALALGGATTALRDPMSVNPAALAGLPRSASVEVRRGETDLRVLDASSEAATSGSSSRHALSSASIVIPARLVTWAIRYDSPLDATASSLSLNPFTQASVSLHLQRYGVSAASAYGPLAFGATFRFEQLHEFSHATFDPGRGVLDVTSARSYGADAGVLWKVSDRIRAGAAYSSSAHFDGLRLVPAPISETLLEIFEPVQFRTASSWRAGVAVDATPDFTISADAARVQYAGMMHEQRSVSLAVTYPNVTELRAGAEYRIGAVALRGGWWHDPSHNLVWQGEPPSGFSRQLPPAEDRNHVTAGIGVGRRVRVEAAIDRAPHSSRASLGLSSSF